MTQASTVTGSARIAEENRKSIARRNLRTGLLFTAPALIVLAVFVFYPAIETFIVSLTSTARESSLDSKTTSSCSIAPISGPM